MHSSDLLSKWFNSHWTVPIGADDLVKHALMLAGAHQFPLNQVVWSLVHELRLSLILPVLLVASRYFGLPACVGIAVACQVAAELYAQRFPEEFPRGLHGFLFDAAGPGPSLLISSQFLICFVLGAALALHRERIRTSMGGVEPLPWSAFSQ